MTVAKLTFIEELAKAKQVLVDHLRQQEILKQKLALVPKTSAIPPSPPPQQQQYEPGCEADPSQLNLSAIESPIIRLYLPWQSCLGYKPVHLLFWPTLHYAPQIQRRYRHISETSCFNLPIYSSTFKWTKDWREVVQIWLFKAHWPLPFMKILPWNYKGLDLEEKDGVPDM